MKCARPLGALTSILAALLVGTCSEPHRPTVLIITVDTLRADFLGIYGDPKTETPHIDELAAASTVFERAAAPMPITRPSHFSMLTAKYPRQHGVTNNFTPLPASAQTLAEIMQEAGYPTAAFVGVALLDEDSGAAQGFEHFNAPRSGSQRTAKQVVQRALKWIRELPEDESFFLWVHLFDPHMPYAPPAEFRPTGAGSLTFVDWRYLDEIAEAHEGDVPISVLEQTKELYRGEIAYADHWIGRLLNGLAQRFDLDDALIILAADHGECFENGVYFDHAHCMFEPAMQIPLVVRYPQEFSPGTRIRSQTSIVDITPTVLAAIGIDASHSLSGRPLQEASEFGDRHVLIQHAFYHQVLIDRFGDSSSRIRTVAGQPLIERIPDQERVGVVGVDWKYLASDASEELFKVGTDADERENLVTAKPDLRETMRARLQELLAQYPRQELAPPDVDEDVEETLEALGYLD